MVSHDQVVVRLGRQRWRIRGRIESDDTQAWDEEEMVFLPHIHHNFEIKVGGHADAIAHTHTQTPSTQMRHQLCWCISPVTPGCVSRYLTRFPSGDGGEGPGMAAGRHGNVRERRLLRGEAAADAGGRHGAGDHQTAAGGRLEVRIHKHTHTHTHVI